MGRIVRRWALAVTMAGTMATACGLPAQNSVTYTAYQLTCCTQTDIEQFWQPGTTVDLHWIVETASRTTVNPSHRVVIVTSLMGPYSDVTTSKHATGATLAVPGSIITMDDRNPPPTQITTFVLPADLPAGYYRLDIKWDLGDGSSAGASSVVRVGTATAPTAAQHDRQSTASQVPSQVLLEGKGAQRQPPASETCGSSPLQICPDQ